MKNSPKPPPGGKHELMLRRLEEVIRRGDFDAYLKARGVLPLEVIAGHRNEKGQSLLFAASVSEREEIQPRLITDLAAIGVDVNVPDEEGNYPLTVAASRGRLETLKALLAAGADPNVADRGKQTALTHLSTGVTEEARRAVRLLAESGANVNHQDRSGSTALHYASTRGLESAREGDAWECIPMVSLLFELGADGSVQNELQRTAYMLFHWREEAERRASKGRDMSSRDMSGPDMPDRTGSFSLNRGVRWLRRALRAA